jgi:putative phosphoribosyl transferase
MIFRDRDQAARLLEAELSRYRSLNPIVFGLPAGGVPMAKVIADALGSELDVILVKKLMGPGSDRSVGVVAEDGGVYFAPGSENLEVLEDDLADRASLEIDKLQAKRRLLTPHRDQLEVDGRAVILVDDGITTGETISAAARSLMEQGAVHLVVASPVASNEAVERLEREGAETCVLSVPEDFFSVSQFYEDLSEVEDFEIVQMLSGEKPEIKIHDGEAELRGYLVVPDRAKALIFFVQGSGSGRHSPRNQYIARFFQNEGLATLFVDLMAEEEFEDKDRILNIGFLARRVGLICEWIDQDPQLSLLPFAMFASSTGAAAAITASVKVDGRLKALVCRGGRPDLAMECLPLVRVPTMFIVGGEDEPVLSLNREAFEQLNCEKDLRIIEKAGHLFEEPGALEKMVRTGQAWLERYLLSEALETDLRRAPQLDA